VRCNEEIPLVKGAERRFSREGLKVVWVGFQDRRDKIMKFMRKHNISKEVGLDEGDKLARQFGIKYGAGLVIIDAEGVVRDRLSRGFTFRVLSESILAALKLSQSAGGG